MPPRPQAKLGPILLAPGIKPANAMAFAGVAVASLSLYVFLNFMQPYVLQGQVAVAPGATGRLTSHLAVLQELIVLALVGPLGALSDRVGRKIVFAVGLVIVACALVLYSFTTHIGGLYAARILFAAGTAATNATLASVAADYPDNSARGKFLALMLMTQQIAILLLVANLAARMPAWLVAHGMDKIAAGRITFQAAASVGLAGAVLAYFGLSSQRVALPVGAARASLVASLGLILRHISRNPAYILVVAIAFVARGDTAIMSGFFSLWVVKSLGSDKVHAISVAGNLLSASTFCGMASALWIGWSADKVNRVAALVWALLAAGFGNILLLSVHNFAGWPVYALVGFIAAAETAVVICGQALLGEQTPAALRGAAVGVFSIFGSMGVLILVQTGGVLFDLVSGPAPFAMLGLVNLAAALAAFFVWRRGFGSMAQPGLLQQG